MKLECTDFRLILKDTFTISHGSYQFRDTFFIKMTKGEFSGLGEATVIPYLGVSLKGLLNTFEKVKERISNFSWDHPLELHKKMEPLLREEPFLLSAIDCAAWDLYGKSRNKPLYELLDLDSGNIPLSSYTIGHGSRDEMLRKMNDAPWPVYKIKTSSRKDLDLIAKLRNETDSVFRIDANCSWESKYLYEDYEKLLDLRVDLLEQPLAMGEEIHQKKDRHLPGLPVIADESCSGPEDVIKCEPWFDGVNIKLMKCGGISPALEMIKTAKTMGLKVMGGCMTESSIGISAMAQLSPLFDYIDLDGAALLSNDPATGVVVDGGVIRLSDLPGLGCSLNRDAIGL